MYHAFAEFSTLSFDDVTVDDVTIDDVTIEHYKYVNKKDGNWASFFKA